MRPSKTYRLEKVYPDLKAGAKPTRPPVWKVEISVKPIQYNKGGTWRDITFRVEPRKNIIRGDLFSFDEMLVGGFPIVLDEFIPLYRIALDEVTDFAITPVGVKRAQGVYTPNDGLVKYHQPWQGTEIHCKNAGHRIAVDTHLKPGHPRVFEYESTFPLQPPDIHGRIWINKKQCIEAPVLYHPDPEKLMAAGDYIPDRHLLKWEVVGTRLRVILPDGDWSGWILDPTFIAQPGAAAGIDTFVNYDNGANFGTNTKLDFDRPNSGTLDFDDAMIRFDLSPIPVGSSIDTYDFQYYVTNQSAAQAPAWYGIQAANDAWTELGADWQTRDNVNNWAGFVGAATGGCGVIGTDLFNNPINPHTDFATGGGEKHVTSADAGASIPNFQESFDDYHGWKYRANTRTSGGTNRIFKWGSSDNLTEAQRPKITITYTPPAATRLAAYYFSIWDPKSRIFDRKGAEVPPNELRADTWMSVLGADMPRGEQYGSFVQDPSKTKLVSVEVTDDGARIVSNPNQFADVIIKRAGAGI
jgi:hypothetical protein